jgi:hypothetical protein
MTTGLKNYSDVHYTRRETAKLIIDHFSPVGKILEPFKGGGAFYNNLPEGADWCETQEGRDFFAHKGKVDWIITNPPFSNLTDVMSHAFEISFNTVLLVPLSKVYSSAPRMRLVRDKAGIAKELMFGSGRAIGFDLGFPFAAMHFVKGYQGGTTKDWSYWLGE